MTDDEKFLWKDLTLEECNKYTRENVRISLLLDSILIRLLSSPI